MTHSLTDYLTKAETSEAHGRSKRQLTRDLSQAVRMKDHSVLEHCVLTTEEGETITGSEVTLDMIDDLIEQKKVPTWYIHKDFAPVLCKVSATPRKAQVQSTHTKPASEAKTQPLYSEASSSIVTMLQEQVADLKKDKDALQRDKDNLLEIVESQSEQIATANERTRESNLLMNRLIERFPDALPEKSKASVADEPNQIVETVTHTDAEAMPAKTKGQNKVNSNSKRAKSNQSKTKRSASNKKPAKKTQSKPAKQKSFWEKNLPTFFDRS